MNRSAFAVPAIVLFLSVVMWGAAKPPPKEERVHGTVLAASARYCEPKKAQGCTGTLTLDSRSERRTIRIPLGTPITAGCEPLAFGDLPGRDVVVTEVDEPSGPVAKAVSALDATPGRPCWVEHGHSDCTGRRMTAANYLMSARASLDALAVIDTLGDDEGTE